MDDKKLWELTRKGDKTACAYLFQKYADAMFCYGMKITPDRELVKDAISDIFVHIINNYQNLSSDVANLKVYLLISLRYKLIDIAKSMSPFLSMDADEGLRFFIETNCSDNDIEDMDDSKLNNLYNLERAMKELTNRQREAIYLYYIQEITIDEIARIFEMNRQSVYNLIHRGIKKLRSKANHSSQRP